MFKQRAEYKLRSKDKPSRITNSQIKKLNSVGFAWEAKTNDEWRKYDLLRKQVMVDGVWNHHFNELCEFKEKNGTFVSIFLFVDYYTSKTHFHNTSPIISR